jgi:hypothetical protein
MENKQINVIKEYSTKVNGKEFVESYVCKSESEVLNSEIDYYTKLLFLTDGYVLENDKEREV